MYNIQYSVVGILFSWKALELEDLLEILMYMVQLILVSLRELHDSSAHHQQKKGSQNVTSDPEDIHASNGLIAEALTLTAGYSNLVLLLTQAPIPMSDISSNSDLTSCLMNQMKGC